MSLHPNQVLLAPVVSEKSYSLITARKYTFKVHEDAHKIVLVADLPGIDQKDVEINVEDNVLTLKGERKPEKVEGEAFRRYERAYGVFTRTFTLPRTVAADKVTAEMKAGVLTLTLPKRAEAQPRQIKINVG